MSSTNCQASFTSHELNWTRSTVPSSVEVGHDDNAHEMRVSVLSLFALSTQNGNWKIQYNHPFSIFSREWKKTTDGLLRRLCCYTVPIAIPMNDSKHRGGQRKLYDKYSPNVQSKTEITATRGVDPKTCIKEKLIRSRRNPSRSRRIQTMYTAKHPMALSRYTTRLKYG